MSTVSRILGEARPPTEVEKRDPHWAYLYADSVLSGRWPKGEAAIAKDPIYAYRYATEVLDGRFPEGEKAIATDAYYAYLYAEHVIKGRWPEAEKAIAADPRWSEQYLKIFPDAKLDWAMNGLIDWTDL